LHGKLQFKDYSSDMQKVLGTSEITSSSGVVVEKGKKK